MRIFAVLLSLCCLITYGCTPVPIDSVLLDTQMQNVQKAISNAEKLDAERFATDEYSRAIKLLRFAQQAQDNGDIAKSMEFAHQAELVAQIAENQAKQQQIQEEMISIQEQMYQELITEKEYENQMEKIRNEIKTAEYAQALKDIQAEKARAGTLTTVLTETKDALRVAVIRVPLSGTRIIVTLAKQIYPDIEETAEYERVQATISRASSHLDRKEFPDAEKEATEARTQADKLFEQAIQLQKLRTTAETSALIAIERADVKIKHAESLNAETHDTEQYRKARAQLTESRNALKEKRFKDARQKAVEAEQTADAVISISEATEFRLRAEQELAAEIKRAQNAVANVKEAITLMAETKVPQLAPQLYELATTAFTTAETALAQKEYAAAEKAAKQSDDYLQRAIKKTEKHDTAQTALVQATKQIPKAAIVALEEGVLIRISGNLFATTSTRLKEDYFPTFLKLAEILKQDDFNDYVAIIEGHTDSLGAAGANKVLTEKRANSVKTFLIKRGSVSEKRLTAIGYGESKPIDENSQEKNRRIDIILSRPE